MKKCNDCNVEMIEDTNYHIDYVGGAMHEECIYLTYEDNTKQENGIFGNLVTERVMARVCPKCGKVELFVETENTSEF